MQFGTHDVVVLKPNKADLGAPALGQGVVYRLKVYQIKQCNGWLHSYLVSICWLFPSWFCVWCFGVLMEQDSSITVAFDDIPEEGLNSPLRLEKVANEVCFFLTSSLL